MQTMKVSDLLKKFRDYNDRVNFCRENNAYLPPLPGFGSDFFLEWLRGNKKLLPLGCGTGFNFNYFTRGNFFTKQHIWQYYQNNQELRKYIPDNISLNSLNRNYLLTVLAYVDRNTWLALYNAYKEKLSARANDKWDTYGIQISNDVAQKINNYISSDGSKGKKPFHLSKRGQPNQSIIRLNPQNNANNQNQIVNANIQNQQNQVLNNNNMNQMQQNQQLNNNPFNQMVNNEEEEDI